VPLDTNEAQRGGRGIAIAILDSEGAGGQRSAQAT